MKKLLLICALILTGCTTKNKLDDKTIVIGCSPTPHALILRCAEPLMEKKGYKLDIKEINDYVTPNMLLASGDLDANYFQHVPYLEDFNEKNGTSLKWACKVHFEPMGIYSLKHTDFTGSNFKIAIPNDVSNGLRASMLLTEYNLDGEIIPMEAQSLPSVLHDVDFAVINGNYALSSNIVDKCLATESSDSKVAMNSANVIAVKDLDYPWVKDLVEVMTSDAIRIFIEATFGDSVKAVF